MAEAEEDVTVFLKRVLKNKTRGWKCVGDILRAHRRDSPTDTPVRDEIVRKLITVHAKYDEKRIGEHSHIVVRANSMGATNEKSFATFMVFPDGSTDGISLNECIKSLFDGKDATLKKNAAWNVTEAFRHANNQNGCKKRIFNINMNRGTACSLCGSTATDADHHPTSFAEIMDGFLSSVGRNAISFEVIKVQKSKYAVAEWRFRNRSEEKAWQQYHDERAEFRPLCSPCNSSQGSGGYRRDRAGRA